ncbi:MAG: hypothetical protein HYX75_21985 [Acidobacteria bacterium]|nr:hypothetical protein [Acidobacteriota bacterium]
MKELFKDKEHLVRMVGLFGIGFLLFGLMKIILVPNSFGLYGHYRGDSLAEVAAQPVAYAGRGACIDCHSDIDEARTGSKHAVIGCEACHGPLAAHVAEPEKLKPKLPDGEKICLRCHLANPARPVSFPQITLKDHSTDDPCTSCHPAHHPEIS